MAAGRWWGGRSTHPLSRCGQMATPKTCPHGEEARVSLSGTKVRDMLRAGERPPIEFSRPEVADILIAAMQGTQG